MKHNNSNQSISGKKFMGSIKKHGEGGGSGTIPPPQGAPVGNQNPAANPGAGGGSTIGMASGMQIPNNANQVVGQGGAGKKNYMSPYSQKIVQKPGN
jgi:hypothetical protein